MSKTPVLALCALALASCSGASTPTDSVGAGGTQADASATDGGQDVSAEWIAPLDGFNPSDGSGPGDLIVVDLYYQPPDAKVVEGSTECVPDGGDFPSLTSCCNHEPCFGQCVELDDGSIGCWCYGITGGCGPGSVCCPYRTGCTVPQFCDLP